MQTPEQIIPTEIMLDIMKLAYFDGALHVKFVCKSWLNEAESELRRRDDGDEDVTETYDSLITVATEELESWYRSLLARRPRRLARRAIRAGSLEILKKLGRADIERLMIGERILQLPYSQEYFIEVIKILRSCDRLNEAQTVDDAIKYDKREVLAYLCDTQENNKWSKNACRLAAEYNNLEILTYLHSKWHDGPDGRKHRYPLDSRALSYAAKHNNLKMLIFVHKNLRGLDDRVYLCSPARKEKALDMDVIDYLLENDLADRLIYVIFYSLACNGEMDKLEYVIKKGYNAGNQCIINDAIAGGQLEVAKRALGSGFTGDPVPPESREHLYEYLYHAVIYGELEILKFLLGCLDAPVDDASLCIAAAEAERLDILKCLREHGCPWDKRVCDAAADGEIEILKWAYENGCPWTPDISELTYANCGLKTLKYAASIEGLLPEHDRKKLMYHIECVDKNALMRRKSLTLDQMISVVNEHRKFGLIKYLINKFADDSWRGPELCRAIEKCGPLKALKLLHEKGCEFDRGTIESILVNGDFKMVKYLNDSGLLTAQFHRFYTHNYSGDEHIDEYLSEAFRRLRAN